MGTEFDEYVLPLKSATPYTCCNEPDVYALGADMTF